MRKTRRCPVPEIQEGTRDAGDRGGEEAMHGRPRRPTKPEDEEAASAKAAKLRDLQVQVLQNHHSRT